MDQDRLQALLAVSLVEGMLRGDAVANSLAVETFDDLDVRARVARRRASIGLANDSPQSEPVRSLLPGTDRAAPCLRLRSPSMERTSWPRYRLG